MKTFFGYSKDDKMVADWEKYFTFSNRTFVCIRDNVEEWEYLYGNKDAYNGTSKKTYVRNIQKDLGMPIDQCDGVFGDITETKVLDFQKLRGIKEDGRVGYITKVELYKYILSNFQ